MALLIVGKYGEDDVRGAHLRRLTTLAIVIALHLVLLLLLTLAPAVTRAVEEGKPFIVRLLPLPSSEAPALPAPSAPKPPITEPLPTPPTDATKPAPPVSVTPRPSAIPVPTPLPAPAAPAVVPAPSGDIVMGGGRSRAAPVGFAPARWVRKITDEEFFPLMQEDLWRVPMDVTFRLRCLVAADMRIDCRILSESPTIPGVRTAVLKGLPLLRMRPPMRDGRPLLDQPVEFEWRVGQHSRFSALDR